MFLGFFDHYSWFHFILFFTLMTLTIINITFWILLHFHIFVLFFQIQSWFQNYSRITWLFIIKSWFIKSIVNSFHWCVRLQCSIVNGLNFEGLIDGMYTFIGTFIFQILTLNYFRTLDILNNFFVLFFNFYNDTLLVVKDITDHVLVQFIVKSLTFTEKRLNTIFSTIYGLNYFYCFYLLLVFILFVFNMLKKHRHCFCVWKSNYNY